MCGSVSGTRWGDRDGAGKLMEPLPDLYSDELDAAALSALIADIEAHAHVSEVLVKGAATVHATAVRPSFSQACASLSAGNIRAVQVRYRWDGRDWSDTVLRTTAGFKVVRMGG